MGQNKPEQTQNREWAKPLWFLFTIGWFIALSLIIPVGIGYWLDLPEQFNSRPIYSLIGFGVGTVIAFLGLYRMLRRFYLEQRNKKGIK